MNQPLSEVLLDVRRAYRLLADYQQRLLELLEYLREQLQVDSYHHVFNNYRASLNINPSKLAAEEASGRTMLPLLDGHVFWLRHQGQDAFWDRQKVGDVMVNIWLRSDKENYRTGDDYNGKDYLPAEASASELAIFVYVCDSPSGQVCNWYSHVWNEVPFTKQLNVDEFDLPGGKFRCYADTLDLSVLGSKEAIDHEITALRGRIKDKLGVQLG